MTPLHVPECVVYQILKLEQKAAAARLGTGPADPVIAARARRVVPAARLARAVLVWAQGDGAAEQVEAARKALRSALSRVVLDALGAGWAGGDPLVLSAWHERDGRWHRSTVSGQTPCMIQRDGVDLLWAYTPVEGGRAGRAAGRAEVLLHVHGSRAEAAALQEAMKACDAAARADGCDLGDSR